MGPYKKLAQQLSAYPMPDRQKVDEMLRKELAVLGKKIVVLDDDPTGVQTVNHVYVYTDWTKESIRAGFEDEQSIFFILTNSRSFTAQETAAVHSEIANTVEDVAQETGKDFIIVSRGDSTLRGHYPLETEVLRETIERRSGKKIDGEVLMPFFKEGGRYTADNIHYVLEGENLVPAGETEFARDKTFGYTHSDLPGFIEEKTGGVYRAEDVVCISLDDLRALNLDNITRQLMEVENFQKIIVNALDYIDVKIFCIALCRAMSKGKQFVFRTAAAFTKVIGGVEDQPLLTRKDLIGNENKNGGLIVVGSHVKKTTDQLMALKKLDAIHFIEFNQHLVVDDEKLAQELARVLKECDEHLEKGDTVAVYTRRERLDVNTGNPEDELRIAVKISDALIQIVRDVKVRPSFIVGKGGITSSDIGTKGLKVKKALVAGQVAPGVPVWLTGPESRFNRMAYVIFPGNVGNVDTLKNVVEMLTKEC